ncbi:MULTISPECIES: SpoIID/LytB domain-containing protein [unclassified Leptolyngbya]|uniref:SpoIID/LytB domain-containing protein n=1 Tax=unclassified Leptolyngbya TaxID=2650499 RepID=UPI001689FEA3|nr:MULTISPECIES: SpoIID/LytB domain-containing protein [unclassified Leptolyngbya]MBD1913647.1 SpoIID/LytB domain-containing protein [Leptolyngbya sp. FACHB-8]MBD2158245.1 SpoIID/LytB domain-containing protein [Leptolyngbya sp. FACHB-16]
MTSIQRILKNNLGQQLCAFSLGLAGAVAMQPIFSVQADALSFPLQATSSVTVGNSTGDLHASDSKTQQLPGRLSQAKSDKKTASTRHSANPQPAPAMQIRVRIAHHPSQFEIATSTAATVSTFNGSQEGTMQPMSRYVAQVNTQGIQLGPMQLQNGVMIDPGADGFVFVNGLWYRGRLSLVYADGELLAVNLIDLEQYLYSVVGSEMPASWHPDALRAQAIAARSYALIHISRPASTWFDLGNNERWQAYNGVESEANSTYAAVSDTSAQVLTYDGQILEALYASTQAITDEAHDGFGMSQYGAEELARQGHNYQQILANYYPGAMLARLRS